MRFSLSDSLGELQETIRQCGLTVVNVGNDGKIPGALDTHKYGKNGGRGEEIVWIFQK